MNPAMQARQEQIDRTVYIGNLHPMCTPEVLLEVFKACGDIRLLRIAANTPGFDGRMDPNRTKFGFIEFKTLAAANVARELNGIPLLDKMIKVNNAKAPMMVMANSTMKGPIIIEQTAPAAAPQAQAPLMGGAPPTGALPPLMSAPPTGLPVTGGHRPGAAPLLGAAPLMGYEYIYIYIFS